MIAISYLFFLVGLQINASSIVPTVSPALDAHNVFTNRKISAEFDNVSNLSISEYSLTSEDGTLLGVTVSNDGNTAVMVPAAPLSKGTRFTARIAATMRDGKGNARAAHYSWSFTTIDPSRSAIKFYHDFDDENAGKIYTKDDLKNNWQNHQGGHFGRDGDTAVVVKEPDNSPGNVLSVLHKANEYGARPGVSWASDIGSHEELYLAYDVMFEDGYDFSMGGKLPGLSGGDASVSNGGGGPPNGDDGWSGRLVFFSKKSGYPVDGAIINYMYLPTNTKKYGKSYKWNIGRQRALTPGKWHTLEIRYKMNTPGKANGILQAWLDGELAMDRQSVTYRTIESLKINQISFNTFHGGNSPDWAPSHDQHIFFDNVVLSTQPISH